MSQPITRGLHGALLLALLLAIGGCNTTPPKPPPKPREVYTPPPPPPPTPAPQQQQQQQQTQSGGGERDTAAAAGSYAPPSSNAAEVEIEEVALDGSTVEPSPATQNGGGERTPGGTAPPPSGNAVLSAGAAAGPSGPNMQIGAQTEGEQLAALDAELNQQLNAFDERMRRARAAAESERVELARASSGSAAGAVDGRGGREDGLDPGGAGGAAEVGSGSGMTPDLSGTATPRAGQMARYQPPPGLADGSDDDIVARQLREAASKENDPILREKLWDEYRKYKAGL